MISSTLQVWRTRSTEIQRLSTLPNLVWGAFSGACYLGWGNQKRIASKHNVGTSWLLGLLTPCTTPLSKTTPASITITKLGTFLEPKFTWLNKGAPEFSQKCSLAMAILPVISYNACLELFQRFLQKVFCSLCWHPFARLYTMSSLLKCLYGGTDKLIITWELLFSIQIGITMKWEEMHVP